MSPEAREKLSRLAKERIEAGKMGGAEFGKLGGRGRTKEKRRAAQSVAEAAQESAQQIIAVFKDAIGDDKPISVRLRGAEMWLNVENKEGQLSLQEERADAAELSRDELIKALTEKLTSGPTADILRSYSQIEQETGIVDADVIEEDDESAAA